jgi:Flp pilus assembly protein CpaB
MKSHHALTVFVAALAFLAGYAVSFKPVPPAQQAAAAKESPQYVEVWVACNRLPFDTKLDPPEVFLKRAAFRLGEEPQDAIVVGTLPLKGRRLMRALGEFDFLKEDDLLDTKLPLPESLMLYSVQCNQYGGGRLRPGMRVDVVGSWLDKNRDPKVEVLMENILLAHAAYGRSVADGQPYTPDKMTIAITPDQVKLLTDIENKSGTISLNVRSGLTIKNVVGQQFDPKNERLFSPPKKVQESPSKESLDHLGFFSRLSMQAKKEP